MKRLIVAIAVAAITFSSLDALAGFGGSRGGFSGGGRSSFSGGSRGGSSSFGGSRGGSSFGRSRSGGSSSSSGSSKSFGGSRSTPSAPIVRKNPPSSSSGSTRNVTHNYYGGGYYGGYHPFYGYYGSPYYGGSFFHGFMWGQFFNRPQVVYVGGNTYVAGDNGQPMLDAQGQPIVYQTNPLMTALAFLVWMLILGIMVYISVSIYRRMQEY